MIRRTKSVKGLMRMYEVQEILPPDYFTRVKPEVVIKDASSEMRMTPHGLIEEICKLANRKFETCVGMKFAIVAFPQEVKEVAEEPNPNEATVIKSNNVRLFPGVNFAGERVGVKKGGGSGEGTPNGSGDEQRGA